MAKGDKLTPKRNAFAEDIGSYKYDYDYQAYEANYNCKNMSANAISCETWKLLQNPQISQRVKEVRAEAVKRNHVTVDEVLNELANWLRFDPLSIVDKDTEALLPLRDMDKRARMSLAEIHVQEIWGFVDGVDGKKVKEKIGELKKIKFIDKRAVAESFMKKFGQYVNESNDIASNLEAIKELIDSVKK